FVGAGGGGMSRPGGQSAVTEQVPARELSAAIALDSFSMNFARTAGPALGGFIVASVSPNAAFVLSGLSYAGLIYALSRSIRGAAARPPVRERLATMLVQGVRYCGRARGIRGTLIRSSLFGFLGSPVWALLPLFAKTQFGGEARPPGVLLR
ncbi:MFS transporter, partial [Burkholderia pseudomallei]